MSKKQILIIHLSRLGDMLQSLPAVKLLKEYNPDSEIAYLAMEDFSAPLKQVPWIDNLMALNAKDVEGILTESGNIDHGSFERLFQDFPELNSRYDLLINMTHDRGSSYLTKIINAKEKRGRIFSEQGEIVMAGKWAKYLFAAARNRTSNMLNLTDIYMGMAGVPNRPVNCYLPTNPDIDRQCIEILRDYGFDPERLAVGFQLGASRSFRTWPSECFFHLAKLLADRMGAQIILFGSRQEMKLGDQFRTIPAVINLMGRTSLDQLPSYLKCLDVLVSNDTGPMHMAAAVGVKIVGLFMSTAYFGITGPYGAGHIAIQSNYPCAPCLDSSICAEPLCRDSITPDLAMQAVKISLGQEAEIISSGSAILYRSYFDDRGVMFYKPLSVPSDGFLPWLGKFHDASARINQTLWNEWLGMRRHSGHAQSFDNYGEFPELISILQNSCYEYLSLYQKGKSACRNIISEFQSRKPRLNNINEMIAKLEEIEQGIRDGEGPLPSLKHIHELYSAEINLCNFPQLAKEFIIKYERLDTLVSKFGKILNQASA